jgi:hypothetical protein
MRWVQSEQILTVNAVCFLREAWDQVEAKVIQVGWGIYEDTLGPPEESDEESDGEWKENSTTQIIINSDYHDK